MGKRQGDEENQDSGVTAMRNDIRALGAVHHEEMIPEVRCVPWSHPHPIRQPCCCLSFQSPNDSSWVQVSPLMTAPSLPFLCVIGREQTHTGVPLTCVDIPASPFLSSVSSGELLSFPEPRFPYLWALLSVNCQMPARPRQYSS